MTISNDILEGCKNSNNTCQELLYKHYYGFLLAIGLRYINDQSDARLVTNESFFKIFTKIKQYDNHIPFEYWIRRVMINTCIDFIRKNKKEKFKVELNNENQDYYLHNRNSMNYAEVHIEAGHLTDLLRSVPETSRKVFYLFAIDGYSHKEISSLLDINEGTSKWHVNHARQVLKKIIHTHLKKTDVSNYGK
jgi:RNA polymerase sigma factor (sigma-70 family)